GGGGRGGVGERSEQGGAGVAGVGLGSAGLPLAVELARAGFPVTGIESDERRLAAVRRGDSGLADLSAESVREVMGPQRLTMRSDLSALATQDVVVLCVPTLQRHSKNPDISLIMAAARDVARHLRTGQLVVLESTTYPGTTEQVLLPILAAEGLHAGEDFFLAFAPHRADGSGAGAALKDTPKLVGGVTPACTALAAALYRQIATKVIELTNATVAEVAMMYENTFAAVNTALANEMALVCHHLGISVWEVIEAVGTKPSGFLKFLPGPGIGGRDPGIDPFQLLWKARLNGYEAKFIALADEINRGMPRFIVELISDALNQRRKALRGSRVLVLGVAERRGSADTVESPAVDVIEALLTKG